MGDIDWINMNPHQLELFYHVARCKGVSRAARQMPYGIQQPSVSAQVNALERDLGVTLYQRRPFKLTTAGEELFRFVEPFFGRIAEVRQKLQGAARLRIGASPIVFRDHLPPVIDAMRRAFPDLNMILRASNQPELLEGLERDELDVVISLIPDQLAESLRATEIVTMPLVLLLPRASKIESAADLWGRGRISEPLIALGPNELICQRFQQTLNKLDVNWLPRIEMDSLELIERYVQSGYGIGLSIRWPKMELAARIRCLELPGFPPVKLGILQRAQSELDDKASRTFFEELQKYAAALRNGGSK